MTDADKAEAEQLVSESEQRSLSDAEIARRGEAFLGKPKAEKAKGKASPRATSKQKRTPSGESKPAKRATGAAE